MHRSSAIVNDISRLIELLAPRCGDTESLNWLLFAAKDPKRWSEAHKAFDGIRGKTLAAERCGDLAAVAQYLFEEACAKTLFNLSHSPAPFDSDSPYWVLPNALALAGHVSVSEGEVLACVSALREPRSSG